MVDMGLKSKVSIAKTGANSLRATIPEGIVAYLNLKAGDFLDWNMEVVNNGKIVIVKKVSRGNEP